MIGHALAWIEVGWRRRENLSAKRRILVVSDSPESAEQMPPSPADVELVVQSPMRALALLTREEFDGVYVTSKYFREALQVGRLLRNEEILEGMSDGVVLLDSHNTIVWSNGRLREWIAGNCATGENFYAVLGSPEILGPDFCPFHTALATGQGTSSTLRSSDGRFFHIHAAPVRDGEGLPLHLIVTVRDVTHEVHQQQKLAAIHQAGMDLADLTPEELRQMSVPSGSSC